MLWGLSRRGVPCMSSLQRAYEEFQEYIEYAECHCCFPYWEYDGVRVTDVWRWWDEAKKSD